MADRTVTIAQAAELTGLSHKALTRRVECGALPAKVEAGVRHIPLSALYREGLLKGESGHDEESGVDRTLDRVDRMAQAFSGLVAQLRAELAVERGET